MGVNLDRETLRALADEGNEKALDRLADLADRATTSRSSATSSMKVLSTPATC